MLNAMIYMKKKSINKVLIRIHFFEPNIHSVKY